MIDLNIWISIDARLTMNLNTFLVNFDRTLLSSIIGSCFDIHSKLSAATKVQIYQLGGLSDNLCQLFDVVRVP